MKARWEDLKELTDNELLNLDTKDDDDSVIAVIYRRYNTLLGLVAIQFTRNQEDAKDVVQEVFESLYKRRDKWCDIQDLRKWLIASTSNKAIDLVRKYKARDKHTHRSSTLQAVLSTPQDQYDVKVIKSTFFKRMEGLPPHCREIFLLSVEQQLSNTEISTIMGLADNTVTIYLNRAYLLYKTVFKDYNSQLAQLLLLILPVCFLAI